MTIRRVVQTLATVAVQAGPLSSMPLLPDPA